MDDKRAHPSEGLVPGSDTEVNPEELGYETPDTFADPLDEDDLENILPEEGVSPEDVAFVEDLEGGFEPQDEAGDSPDSTVTPYEGDTDFEEDLEDAEVERYGDDEV
jgi:hypothetical protein